MVESMAAGMWVWSWGMTNQKCVLWGVANLLMELEQSCRSSLLAEEPWSRGFSLRLVISL